MKVAGISVLGNEEPSVFEPEDVELKYKSEIYLGLNEEFDNKTEFELGISDNIKSKTKYTVNVENVVQQYLSRQSIGVIADINNKSNYSLGVITDIENLSNLEIGVINDIFNLLKISIGSDIINKYKTEFVLNILDVLNKYKTSFNIGCALTEYEQFSYTNLYPRYNIVAGNDVLGGFGETVEGDNRLEYLSSYDIGVNVEVDLTKLKSEMKYNDLDKVVITSNCNLSNLQSKLEINDLKQLRRDQSINLNELKSRLQINKLDSLDTNVNLEFVILDKFSNKSKFIHLKKLISSVLVYIPKTKLEFNFNRLDNIFIWGGLVYSGDNVSGQADSAYTFKNPTKLEYTFYIAAKDRSGNYSEPQAITVEHPGIQKLGQPIIEEHLQTIEITPPPAYDFNGNPKAILGYKVYITPLDNWGNPDGNTKIKKYPVDQLVDAEGNYDDIVIKGKSGQEFEVQITAYDSAYESTPSDPLYPETRFVEEPDIPDSIIGRSKLVNELESSISLTEHRAEQNESWIDQNEDSIIQTVNDFDSNTFERNTSRVTQLSDRYTVRIQRQSDNVDVITGFGLSIDDDDESEFTVLADRFKVYGAGKEQSIFGIDTEEEVVYFDASQFTIRAGDNGDSFFDLDGSGLSVFTKDFQLTKDGKSKFGGELQAASGNFAGNITAEGTISYDNLDINYIEDTLGIITHSGASMAEIVSYPSDKNGFLEIYIANFFPIIDYGSSFSADGNNMAAVRINHTDMRVLSGLAEIKISQDGEDYTEPMFVTKPGRGNGASKWFDADNLEEKIPVRYGIERLKRDEVVLLFEVDSSDEVVQDDAEADLWIKIRRHSIS